MNEEDAERVVFNNEQVLTRYQEIHFNVLHRQKSVVLEVKTVRETLAKHVS